MGVHPRPEPQAGPKPLLQERLYLVDSRGGDWRVRPSPLDRALSTHDTEEAALMAAKVAGRRWAPARIKVFHSGRIAAEWYIRYPDGEWLSADAPPGGDLPAEPGYSGQSPEATP